MIKEKQKSAFVYFSILTILCLTLPGFIDRLEIHSHGKRKTWKRHHITAKSWAEGCAEKKQSLFFNVLTNKESLCVFFPVLKQFNLFCAEWFEEIRVPCLVSCHDRSEKGACRDNITNTCVLLSPSSTFSRMFTLQWIGWIRRNINTYHKVQDTF